MSVVKKIGTDHDCDVILRGRYISRHHAALSVKNGFVFIEDLGSTFGTHVNGEVIDRPRELQRGDRVKLGTQVFHWEDYLESNGGTTEGKHPIFVKDLFSPTGLVKWEDYKFVLLLTLGLTIVIPLAIPVFLLFAEDRLRRHSNNEIVLMQYVEPIGWIVGLIALFVFINLTQTAVRYSLARK